MAPELVAGGGYGGLIREKPHCAVAVIPVNPFCWSKSAEHDVTLTSLTADLL